MSSDRETPDRGDEGRKNPLFLLEDEPGVDLRTALTRRSDPAAARPRLVPVLLAVIAFAIVVFAVIFLYRHRMRALLEPIPHRPHRTDAPARR